MSASSSPSPAGIVADSLLSSRWHELTERETCFAASSGFRALAKAADGAGKKSEAAHLMFLANLCGMVLTADSGRGPFVPQASFDGRRSLLPQDLTTAELDAIAAFAEEPTLPATVRARIFDVLWLQKRPRNPEHGRRAIDAYRERTPHSAHWFKVQREEWSRAIQLCLELGSDCVARLQEIEHSLLHSIVADEASTPGLIRSAADLAAMHRMGRAKSQEVAERLEHVGQDQAQRSDWHSARELFLMSAHWFRRRGDEADAARTTAAAADMWTREAAFFESSHGTGYLMAGSAYEAAIQLLRSVPRKQRAPLNVDDRIVELRRRLRESHQRSVDAMEPSWGDSVDLRSLTETARSAVAVDDPMQALIAFIRIAPSQPAGSWREQAEKTILQYPLQALFSTVRYAENGRLAARSPGVGLTDASSPGWKEAVHERAVQNLSTYHQLVVHGGILPALSVMRLKHPLSEEDFVALAARSPAIPCGRERTFGRALSAGYQGDYVVAVHLLAPQIEHLVRAHVVAVGGETRRLDESGIESEIGLSALMELPEVETVFGESLAFELRSIFCDGAGPNLRNAVAHGLLNDDDILSPSAVFAWWFSLRLAILPLIQATSRKSSSSVDQSSDGEEE